LVKLRRAQNGANFLATLYYSHCVQKVITTIPSDAVALPFVPFPHRLLPCSYLLTYYGNGACRLCWVCTSEFSVVSWSWRV